MSHSTGVSPVDIQANNTPHQAARLPLFYARRLFLPGSCAFVKGVAPRSVMWAWNSHLKFRRNEWKNQDRLKDASQFLLDNNTTRRGQCLKHRDRPYKRM